MTPFNAALFRDKLMPMACKLSDDQLDPDLRTRILTFCGEPHSALEIFEFCDKVAEAAFYGKASSFVMQLLNVKEFYEPPAPGEPLLPVKETPNG